MKLVVALALLAGANAFTIGLKDGPGDGTSKSTYSTYDPIPVKNWLEALFPVSTETDECTNDICDCYVDGQLEYVQQGRVYIQDSSYNQMGFGLHSVNCSTNPFPGGMNVQDVEAEFATKVGDMSSFDSFMDYNVALYTADLDSYISTFESRSIDYLATSFTNDDIAYYGVIIKVPNSQMILEIVSKNSTTLQSRETRKLEQRAPLRSLRRAELEVSRKVAAGASSSSMAAIVVNRAASDIDALDEFYVNGMQCTTTLSVDEDDVAKRCYLWKWSTVDVCFTVRSDSATSTDFKVSDFEDMLNTVHANIITGDNCNNKWIDNHYAVDGESSSADYIVSYIEEKGDIYYYCDPALHYIVDPTGWGIQLDLPFSSAPSGCSAYAEKGGPNDFCSCTSMTSCGQT